MIYDTTVKSYVRMGCGAFGLLFGALVAWGAIVCIATAITETIPSDRDHYFFLGTILTLIALFAAGFSLKWMIEAFRLARNGPKPPPAPHASQAQKPRDS